MSSDLGFGYFDGWVPGILGFFKKSKGNIW